MVKKILLLSTVLLINISYSSERAKSPKPYATLGAFLNTSSSKPITMDEVIRQTKALQNTHYSDISDEIKRYEQLEKNYEIFCANLKTRGLKEKHDTCKAHAQNCRNKIEELLRIEQELKQLDDDIYNILNDDSLGAKPYRWVAARPLYVRTVQISPKDSEQHKEAKATLEFIDNKKQPIVDQLNFIKKLELDGNITGMVKAYESLLLLSPESQVAIHARITELKKRITKENALYDTSRCIAAIKAEETSTTERFEKVIDYCNRTLMDTSDPDVQELCKSERLKHRKALAYFETATTPSICNNEFIHTAYDSAIAHATSVELTDIRNMIKEEQQYPYDFTESAEEETMVDTAQLITAKTQVLKIMEKISTTCEGQQQRNAQIKAALENIAKARTSAHLVALANAYHARAEFNQQHYSEKYAALIARDRYDAHATGLQAFNKDKHIREQLNFAL